MVVGKLSELLQAFVLFLFAMPTDPKVGNIFSNEKPENARYSFEIWTKSQSRTDKTSKNWLVWWLNRLMKFIITFLQVSGQNDVIL